MRVFATFIAVGIGLTACDNAASDWEEWSRKEALGLSFALPPHMTHRVSDRTIALKDTRNVRQPEWVSLYLVGETPPRLFGDDRVVQEGRRPAPYVIVEQGSGSGGTEYGLSTSRLVGKQRVAIFANVQTEWGVPDFPTAWAVWESLRPADQAASDVSTNRAQ